MKQFEGVTDATISLLLLFEHEDESDERMKFDSEEDDLTVLSLGICDYLICIIFETIAMYVAGSVSIPSVTRRK